MKKSQAAVEYLMITAVSLLIIVPAVYLFSTFVEESKEESALYRVDEIGRTLVDNINAISYTGDGSRAKITAALPDEVVEVAIYDSREIVFTIRTSSGESELVYVSDVNITLPGCPPVGKCIFTAFEEPGVKEFVFEDVGGVIVFKDLGGSSPNPVPISDFIGVPLSGFAPLLVTFTDTSTNAPTSWAWTFGDGGNDNVQNPIYTYNNPGVYDVSLQASNGFGGGSTELKLGYVTVNSLVAPTAEFTADVTSGNQPLTVTFTDLSTDGPTSWVWDFGDGGNDNVQNPIYTYNNPGVYTVSLQASNGAGSDTEVKTNYITVIQVGPQALLGNWSFDEGSGPTAFDSSGHGHDIDIEPAAAWTTGMIGGGWDFDSNPVLLDRPSASFSVSGDFTFGAWVAHTTTGSESIFSLTIPSVNPLSGGFDNNVGGEMYFENHGGPSAERHTNVPFNDNHWHHYIVRRTGTTYELFVDGVSYGTETGTAPNYDGIYLGAWAPFSNNYGGLIDEVVLWNYSISVSEIKQIFNNQFPGPVLNITFDGDSGSTATDTSGYGLDGTLTTGQVWTTGLKGDALDFAGTGDGVNFGRPGPLKFRASDFTYAAWVKTTDSATNSVIVGESNNAAAERYIYLRSDNKAGFFVRDINSDSAVAISTTDINDGFWHHVVGVWDGSTAKIYVDGVEEGSQTNVLVDSTEAAADVIIGARDHASPLELDGVIDEALIYRHELSPTEVQDLYNSYPIPVLSYVVGTLFRDGSDDLAFFFTNGTYGSDGSHTPLASDPDGLGPLIPFNILGGYQYENIVGVETDQDANTFAVFFNNGDYLVDTLQGDFATTPVDADDATYTYTLPGGFNFADIVGFAYEADVNDLAVFFNDGTFVSENDNADFSGGVIDFIGAYSYSGTYTIPSGWSYQDIVGFASEESTDDVAVFLQNGSFAIDSSQATYDSNMDFTSSQHTATFP